MKRIVTNGSTNLEPLSGSSEWYWGTDYASGDLRARRTVLLSNWRCCRSPLRMTAAI